MKKPYAKPALYAESFELVEHIAGTCATPDGFAGAQHREGTPGGCGYNIGGAVLFQDPNGSCKDDTFNEMLAFYEGSIADMSIPQIAEALGLECYNSMYSAGTSFFAS